MKKKIMITLGAAALASVMLVGCGQTAQQNQGTANKTESVAADSKESVTLENAKEIAIKDSGVDKSEIGDVYAELKKENNSYLIAFIVGETEYQYGIDAVSGKIIMQDVIKIDADAMTSATAEDGEKPKETGKAISEKKAIKIALDHAEVKKSDTDYIRAHKDYDDGVEVYEIEFTADGMEYEYEIEANTGNIYSADSEAIDFD